MAQQKHVQLSWRLALKLARREMQGGPDGRAFSGFRIFLLCLVLGVFTIAAVGSLSASLVGGMAQQGQAILGADMDLRLVQRAAFDDERQWLAQQKLSEIATMRVMARSLENEDAMLVESKAVDAAYPLYGQLTLSDNLDLATALQKSANGQALIYGAVAEQGLFDRMDLKTGAILAVGEIRIQLNAVLLVEPDRNAGGFPLAPRLMLSHEALKAAGLLRPGALVNYHYRLRLPEGADNEAVKALRLEAQTLFPNAGWRIRDRSDASPSMRRLSSVWGYF